MEKGETVMSGATQFKWAFGNTVEMAKIQVKISKPLNCELYKEQDHIFNPYSVDLEFGVSSDLFCTVRIFLNPVF